MSPRITCRGSKRERSANREQTTPPMLPGLGSVQNWRAAVIVRRIVLAADISCAALLPALAQQQAVSRRSHGCSTIAA